MSRRQQRAAQNTAAAQERRPAFGPWNESDTTGYRVCPTHDYGIPPGMACLRCRIAAATTPGPEARERRRCARWTPDGEEDAYAPSEAFPMVTQLASTE